jgi:biotin operon repressor
MLYFIIPILLIIILFLIWKGFLGGRAKANKPPLTPPILIKQGEKEPPLTPPISQGEAGGEQNGGICAVAMGQSREKMENKQKILDFLQKNGKATNSELRELLGVSERTIVDYMDELEKSGQARQVNETGRATHYILK